MTDLNIHISAVDTLMFRDGRPFNQNDAGASEAVSVFPPYPPTIVGAVRAALWRQAGEWNKDWGDGTNWQKNDLGKLAFDAPILLKDGEPVFPVPLHILEGKIEENGKEKDRTVLKPVSQYECDLGKVKLPIPQNSELFGLKTIEDRWVKMSGMEKILNGGVPAKNDLIKRNELWKIEPRVGIGIDPKTRGVKDTQLYMASHVRMRDNVSLHVSLKNCDIKLEKSLSPLAGEHRMAEIFVKDEAVKMPDNVTNFEDEKWCMIALSPVVPCECGTIGKFNNNIISACLGKAQSIGGWDSQSKTPIPLRRCIPAGSVWFMKGNLDNIPASIGQATEWGFGQVLIGKW